MRKSTAASPESPTVASQPDYESPVIFRVDMRLDKYRLALLTNLTPRLVYQSKTSGENPGGKENNNSIVEIASRYGVYLLN